MPLVEQSQRADDGGGGDASAGLAERWARIKMVFLEALQYSPSERSAFVTRATSGDVELQREVEALLASESEAGSFCETPAAGLLGDPRASSPDEAPRLSPGMRLGQYEITSFIAAGGMGAVYRARHVLLGREVAIKTLVHGVGEEAAKRRLIREARHASLLSHPNICAIHDVGEADGVAFIVMEYVQGASLGALVRAAKPSVDVALAYGVQIAAALEHAHAHGIIHRDLKSSNIVVETSGKAVVLDFGLARRIPDESLAQQSESSITGAFAGTLSHMAPEVLRGQLANAQSDVWALGVVLYELMTGELPFAGRTAFETSSAILGDLPRPMSASVPLAVRLVIERCLMKDPRARYQSAREVGLALESVRRHRTWPLIGRLFVSTRRRTVYLGAASAIALAGLILGGWRLRSIVTASDFSTTLAVLPLESATADRAAGYYAEGITDALIAQLGAATNVRVLSRASTSLIASPHATAAAIASRLGADAVVQGEIRRTNGLVSIEAKLVRRTDGRVLWSGTQERNEQEILALEADVVQSLAGALRASIRPEMRDRLVTVRAVSPEVYESYLQGRYEWNRRTPRSLELAIDRFSHAVELDPTYAPAHAGLADCYNQLGTVMVGVGSPAQYRPRAAAEAIKALQIDPNSAEAHAALGYVWHYDLRWAEAEREFQRAIELNPSFALAHLWYANLLMSRGRMKEALDQVYAARDLDPFSSVVNSNVGWVLDWAGRHDQAVAHLQQTLALDSMYPQARARLAGALASTGRFDEALEQTRRLLVLTDSASPVLAMMATLEGSKGHVDTTRLLLNELITRSRTSYVPSPMVAQIYTVLGDTAHALTELEQAFAERSNAIAYLAVDPAFAPLHASARFRALLTRAGLR